MIPGQRVGSVEEFTSGPGTYVRGNYLYASLVGFRRVLSFDEDEMTDADQVCCFFPSASTVDRLLI